MSITKIHEVYFSPAGSTRRVVGEIAGILAKKFGAARIEHDYTLPSGRAEKMEFEPDSLVIWGSCVYAGRLPNKLLDYVKTGFHGNNTPAIPVVVYGNRNYDQALSELYGILKEGGCLPFAAAAVAARHVFSPDTIAPGRPDEQDMEEIWAFARQAAEKLQAVSSEQNGDDTGKENVIEGMAEGGIEPVIPGPYPPDRYYTPLGADGQPAKFLKAKPVVEETLCIGCGRCAAVCPVGSIIIETAAENQTEPDRREKHVLNAQERQQESKDRPVISGICIKCQACILACPVHAVSLPDAAFQSHRKMLEHHYTERKNPEFFL